MAMGLKLTNNKELQRMRAGRNPIILANNRQLPQIHEITRFAACRVSSKNYQFKPV